MRSNSKFESLESILELKKQEKLDQNLNDRVKNLNLNF